MFYQKANSMVRNRFSISLCSNKNFKYPPHLHESCEILFVEEGLVRTFICGHGFDVTAGECVVILPNQPHEYVTPSYSKSAVAIFSSDHIPELKSIATRIPYFPVLTTTPDDAIQRLRSANENSFKFRAVLYELTAAYVEGAPAPELSVESSSLVCRIVEYIDTHYTEPMTLEDLAHALGYSYRYMSGVVNRFFNLSLPQVVNGYRINHACELLSSSPAEITEIAMLCGFGSIRNFNRCFKETVGVSPQEYREEQALIASSAHKV